MPIDIKYKCSYNLGMNIQLNIKNLRNAGLTQAEIGRELKRSQATIAFMEVGKYGCTRPSADVVAGIKRLLKKHKIPISMN